MTYNKGKGKGIAFLRALICHRGKQCVLWPYSTEYNDYGHFGLNGKLLRAHKFMCELAHGPAPKGTEAAHSCGRARCVNPNHLSWKTRSANEKDKRRHGTARGGAGGKGGCRTHLTAAQIDDIRKNNNGLTVDALAEKHGLKRGGVRYWQSTTHKPLPPGTSASSIQRRAHKRPAFAAAQ